MRIFRKQKLHGKEQFAASVLEYEATIRKAVRKVYDRPEDPVCYTLGMMMNASKATAALIVTDEMRVKLQREEDGIEDSDSQPPEFYVDTFQDMLIRDVEEARKKMVAKGKL